MNELFKKISKDPILYLIILIGKIFRGQLWIDILYLKILYRHKMKKKLNFKKIETYNEKLQWMKLYDRNPLYTKLVDKYEVRKYISEKIGDEYLIPIIGVWDNFKDIDFDELPNQFVLKCTHDSGGLVICRDKNKLNIEEVRRKINKCLKRNYFYNTREWPYKNVKPRIIAEKYMVDESKKELKDYKFFCFNGTPKVLFIASDRGNDTKFDFYDMEFNHLEIINGHENSEQTHKKPAGFEKMIDISKKLSKEFKHVRIDWYDINGKVYFGEFTFYHFSGLVPFKPESWDYELGSWLNINK